MPFFGSKKKEEKKEKKEKGGYPQAQYQQQPQYQQPQHPSQQYPQGAYPQGAYPQGAYPAQPQGAYAAPPPYGPGAQGPYPDAPPGYHMNPAAQYPRGPAGMAQPQMAPPQYQQVQNTYMIQGGFDAGARFDGVSQPRIPPAPPGCAPNMAQMAAAQGHNVVVTQQKSDWISGSGDGGYVIW